MNNSFNEHIAEICGLELAALAGSYKYSVFGNSTAVVEGHKGMSTYFDGEVGFAVSDGVLKITGGNLRIKCLSKNFAVVIGRIDKVEVAAK